MRRVKAVLPHALTSAVDGRDWSASRPNHLKLEDSFWLLRGLQILQRRTAFCLFPECKFDSSKFDTVA